MNLPYSDISLAKCIGLLHDIGRFEQYKRFKSFKDSNLDHGDYGEKILRDENSLKYFDIKEDDYNIVYTAIRNHNKYEIEPNLSNRELLFTKMIRDADKLDILYALNNPEIKSIILEDNSQIRDSIKEAFFQDKQIIKDDKETKNENIIVMFSFVYDFNFNLSIGILKDNKYYENIYERLHDKEKFKPYIDHVIKYIDERAD